MEVLIDILQGLGLIVVSLFTTYIISKIIDGILSGNKVAVFCSWLVCAVFTLVLAYTFGMMIR